MLPSLSEAFGISIAEAMSYGLPVLTTTRTPWKIIQNKKLGWIVEPNVQELAKATQKLFNSSEKELALMGLRAQEIVSERYDWNKTAEMMKNQISNTNQKI